MIRNQRQSAAVSAVYIAWGICSALILALIFFFSGDVYACKRDFANLFALLFVGLALVLCIYFLFTICMKKLRSDRGPVIVGVVFMVFQIWLMKYYSFHTGWDVQGIIMSAWQAARGDTAYYGWGFMAGAIVYFIIALLRLEWSTRRLPYLLLGRQSAASAQDSGPFTSLENILTRIDKRSKISDKMARPVLMDGSRKAVRPRRK